MASSALHVVDRSVALAFSGLISMPLVAATVVWSPTTTQRRSAVEIGGATTTRPRPS